MKDTPSRSIYLIFSKRLHFHQYAQLSSVDSTTEHSFHENGMWKTWILSYMSSFTTRNIS
jgi:hypothetical protein